MKDLLGKLRSHSLSDRKISRANQKLRDVAHKRQTTASTRLVDQPMTGHFVTPTNVPEPPLFRSMMNQGTGSVTLIVGEEGEVLFELSRHSLCSQSRYFARLLSTCGSPNPFQKQENSDDRYELPLKIRPCDFHDFVQWLYTGRVLQLPHLGIEYAIDYSARRLLDALRLASTIESDDYQNAALRDLHILGQVLPWPEDIVTQIFRLPGAFHPAKRLIVAILAAHTCGKGKRRIRQGPREPGFDRGDSIKGTAFWEMYRDFCEKVGGNYSYPLSVDEAIRI